MILFSNQHLFYENYQWYLDYNLWSFHIWCTIIQHSFSCHPAEIPVKYPKLFQFTCDCFNKYFLVCHLTVFLTQQGTTVYFSKCSWNEGKKSSICEETLFYKNPTVFKLQLLKVITGGILIHQLMLIENAYKKWFDFTVRFLQL